MAWLRLSLLFLLSPVLSGCMISVPETHPQDMCNFQSHRLEVALPDRLASAASAAERAQAPLTAAGRIREVYRQAAAVPAADAGGDDSMLFMSGGSQEGAFGAGVLAQWDRRLGGSEAPGHDTPGRLPNFRIVTGISTGAILATPAFINRVGLLVDHGGASSAEEHNGYAILRESELLRPISRSAGRGLNLRAAIPAVRRGALADLDPLRGMLLRELGREELNAVAAGRDGGRLLLVGVVDVDSGQALALDMTEMADRYRQAADGSADEARLHRCYVDAIIASSSAPLAALPVFIDNRMYIDGGVRFGMFSDEIDLASMARDGGNEGADPLERRLAAANVYAIVNGDLILGETCGRRDPSLCERAGTDGRYGAHADWSLVNLAFRSERILVNQVQRMSLERINFLSKEKGRRFRSARIQPGYRNHPFTMDDPALGSGRLTCAEWRAMDRDLNRPIQFHAREMHCLIAYGRWEFDESLNWHRPPPPAPEVAEAPPKP